MAENENMVVNEVTPPEEQKEKKVTWAKFKAGLKEWLRKRIVNLKRRPGNIAFLFLVVTSLIYILSLGTLSQAVYYAMNVVDWSGISLFGSTLLSILVLVTYNSTFPKRKKMNIFMLCLTFVFIALMYLFDIMFYIEMTDFIEITTNPADYYYGTTTILIVHMVFMAITVLLIATLPLYKKLLLKINTRIEVESTVSNFNEQIDLQDAD